ncbi:MAG TPA: patatin-like phospholipase family protein [Dehalococcoidales bacterium]|nr:patatin-like phospholipase family protein [Dehalococcoidales bacterium]
MNYHFRNLVFEGGGVKGIAYLGAMEVLEEKGILKDISRVGGTSVGAINAVLVGLGYSNAEQREVLWNLDFKNFMDSSWGFFPNLNRVIKRYGWHKGQFFQDWIGDLIARKVGNPAATFKDLKAQNLRDIYIYGTNLSTHFGEVFSAEHTPQMPLAEAVRISMSLPLFFAAVRNQRGDVYVDGGCLNNFPVKLFDREKYILPEDLTKTSLVRSYYKEQNESFLKERPGRSPYTYNKETLGFRLDSLKEMAAFRYQEPPVNKIDNFIAYVMALVQTMLEAQNNAHLHSDDWQRTIYIDTLGTGTTEFGLSDQKKKDLEESGKKGVLEYFRWFDNIANPAINRV